jgi:hypothetical protein
MRHALLAATALLGFTVPYAANATLILDESVNGGAFTTICSGGPSCTPGVVFTDAAGMQFTILGATSNSPGTSTSASVLQATVDLINTSGATQSIVLRVGDTGYTAPTGNVNLLNNISGTVLVGGSANVFNSIACADSSNGQSNCSGAFQTPLIAANITVPGSGANSDSLAIAALGGPFSLTQELDITLNAGGQINFSASADVVPAGEPASLAIMGVGLVGLGWIVSWRRTVSSQLPA